MFNLLFRKKPKTLFIAGIGGIGVSRLARWYRAAGWQVCGSDLAPSPVTDALTREGVRVAFGHARANVPHPCDLLIYTVAVPDTAPERLEAKLRGIRQLSHFEAIAEIARGRQVIAVAGTNGKSTTTAMIGLCAERAGLDPTVFVGSVVPEWQSNVRIGRGHLFIVEADELNRQFLALSPYGVVLTNIEADHLDYFSDASDVRRAFEELVAKIPPGGFCVYNHDDLLAHQVGGGLQGRRIAGFGETAKSIRLTNLVRGRSVQTFAAVVHGKPQELSLRIPAVYNVYNALACVGCCAELKIPAPVVAQTLERFHGVARRFEVLGAAGKTAIISDYGHHPAAIDATLEGARHFYGPDARVLLIFQPHQRRRTRALMAEFIDSLCSAHPDKLIICEIFDVAGREDAQTSVSSLELVDYVSRKIPNVTFAKDLDDARRQAQAVLADYDVCICMGAGDIHKLAEALVKPEDK